MSATTAERPESRPRFERRHLIGTVVLAGLLVLLPLVGIGPMTWRQCVDQTDMTRAAVPEPKPVSKPPLPPPPQKPAEASPPSVPATGTTAPPAAAPVALPPAAPAPAPALAAAAPVAPAARPSAPATPAAAATPRAVLYFGFNSDKPRADARRSLAPIVAYLKKNADAKVQVSGFHDARGHQLYNEDLARRRAVAVSAALERAGIRRNRIVLAKPAATIGDGKPEQARRTEVTIVR